LKKIKNKDENVVKHIPCLYLKSTNQSICPKFAIFFHGNAEDINQAFEILNHIRFTLGVKIIVKTLNKSLSSIISIRKFYFEYRSMLLLQNILDMEFIQEIQPKNLFSKTAF